MNKTIKYISEKTVRPALARYLSKERTYHYNGISLQIPPQVFHPAFFFSTKLLLRYIEGLNVRNKTLLELGAGSGLIAMQAAKKGAIATATDINKTAVKFLHVNKNRNNIPLNIFESNLFDGIPKQSFDIIAINPPYYKKNPSSDAEYAWYCGENSEYFTSLFESIRNYIHRHSHVYIVLCEECDIELIKAIASNSSYELVLVQAKRRLWETSFIFKIENIN